MSCHIFFLFKKCFRLTHWGRVTHICVSKLIIIGSDNGLSPSRHQAIIWTNAGILLIGLLGTNFSEILIEIYTFSFKRMHLKMSSGKMVAILSRPQCVNLVQCAMIFRSLDISMADQRSPVNLGYRQICVYMCADGSHCINTNYHIFAQLSIIFHWGITNDMYSLWIDRNYSSLTRRNMLFDLAWGKFQLNVEITYWTEFCAIEMMLEAVILA